MVQPLLAALFLVIASASAAEVALEFPDVFPQHARPGQKVRHCEENGVVAAWCDTFINPDLACATLPEFDEYGCTCLGNPALCPSECIGGTEPLVKNHYSIRCGKIPVDSPNYILKEIHELNRCENNAAVSSWCDDFVNKHLECGLFPQDDQYLCKCSGKHSNCPDECIGGGEPLVKTAHSVLCSGIPKDSPNYILKEKK